MLTTPPLFFDLLGQPLKAGSWVHVSDWFRKETPLHASFTWQLEERRPGQLTMVAQEVKKSLPFTTARAKQVVAYEPFPTISLKDYPDLWQQWREKGFGVFLTPAIDGGLLVVARRKSSSHTVRLNGQEVQTMFATPNGVREFLAEAIECIVHPRRYKARKGE